jgi:hypothetical protein
VGDASGPHATVDWIPASGVASPTVSGDVDARYSDGGFTLHAVGGRLLLHRLGREPGDAVDGEFELVFRTGETVTGHFAAALAD